MSIVQKILVLQEQDSRIREAGKELRDIPARKHEEETRLNEHRKALMDAQQGLKFSQAEIKKLELESEARREMIVKLRRQQLEIKTNKEFKAMEMEIETVEDAVTALEDQELALMEGLEKAKADVAERNEALKEEEAAVESDVRALDEHAAAIAAEIKEMQALREAGARDVDPEWLDRYEKIFERKDKALVPLEDGVCGGCHMRVAPYIIHDAKKRTFMVTCDFCGRLVY